jgi:hypothetical protein
VDSPNRAALLLVATVADRDVVRGGGVDASLLLGGFVNNFFDATAAELKALGWPRWDETSGLHLCPLAQLESLPDGIALWSISGSVAVKGRDPIDTDTRGGVLAHGIIPGKTRTDASAEQVATREAARRAEFRATLAKVCAENGVLDMASGRMLHGEEAAEAMLNMGETTPGGEA